MRRLIVITAGLSTPSSTRALADALSAATAAKVSARGEGVEVSTIEVRELAYELAEAMTAWGAPTPRLDEAKRALGHADGLIAVTPVFQGSYSGLFKMFFDTLEPSALESLPTLIAASGGSSRHALMLDYALRPLLNYLHALVVPTGIFQATEDFGTEHGVTANRRIERAADQLADLMVAPADRVAGLSAAASPSPREADAAVDPAPAPPSRPTGTDLAEDFVPFSALLHGHDGQAGDQD